MKLVSLRTLAVDGNKLSELPPAMLSQMTHLVELSASRNSLDRIEFREVHHPRYGYRLERLVSFVLYYYYFVIVLFFSLYRINMSKYSIKLNAIIN